MRIRTYADRDTMSRAAARHAAGGLRRITAQPDGGRIIAATGASQLAFLEALTMSPGIDWARIELFHLDEYVGLNDRHTASLRRHLLDRLILPTGIERYHLIDAEHDPAPAVARAGREVTRA